MGSFFTPTTRDTPDNAHKMPGLLRYIQKNNSNNVEDFLGRNNGNYYKNLHDQNLDVSNIMFDKLRKNGVNF
eukprot:CAMPEP_0205808228 /NCGR_PEP_ID=MMETSP0205-20121125/12124_1 /ASSEMBLY_ACC=CAM_ASM_000278 /TAXON_ID=36767 /ORGANISM="Euplotes focardii, Strain TN1" /LENGTH=71 /DNA_ID=CAMNT_0053083581 /DNA_START=322 /DNA_END=537 /DNA_ORIENTATION=-